MSEICLDAEGIQKYIQIRYPVLMVDKAVVEPGVRATGYKYLTTGELFWQGHYPEHPMMPGTYQLEAMGQVFTLTFLLKETDALGGGTGSDAASLPRLAGFDKVRFFHEVQPGNLLVIRTELESLRHGLATGTASAYVEDVCVSSAQVRTKVDGNRWMEGRPS